MNPFPLRFALQLGFVLGILMYEAIEQARALGWLPAKDQGNHLLWFVVDVVMVALLLIGIIVVDHRAKKRS